MASELKRKGTGLSIVDQSIITEEDSSQIGTQSHRSQPPLDMDRSSRKTASKFLSERGDDERQFVLIWILVVSMDILISIDIGSDMSKTGIVIDFPLAKSPGYRRFCPCNGCYIVLEDTIESSIDFQGSWNPHESIPDDDEKLQLHNDPNSSIQHQYPMRTLLWTEAQPSTPPK